MTLSDTHLIALDRVGKRFGPDRAERTSLRQWFIHATTGKPAEQAQNDLTLEEISLRIEKTETVALIGDNGAGKSTLLRLMAGIYRPSTGRVMIGGRVGCVLELGAGFHKELSGEDNLAMYAAALGLTYGEFEQLSDEMVAFADIGDVLKKPIKHYSTGMQARLAISVALCGLFDVILVDEALSVGDQSFRTKVEQRVRDYIADGGTVVLASHDLRMLQRICKRAVWLNRGHVAADGPVEEVADRYSRSKGRG